MKPFDIQVNGYSGVDFCSSDLSAVQLHAACQALRADGVDGVLATLITDTIDNLVKKLEALVRLRERDPVIKKMIQGLHVEGPFLNPAPGFIGAHDAEFVKLASVDDSKRLLEAGKGLIRVVTLAPEMDPYYQTTQYLAAQGVVVSAGHSNASLDQLRGAISSGLSMVTHLGNGCPVELPRHDNFIQRVLHLRNQLWISFIPDGVHIELFALRNYLDLVGIERVIFVTDSISASGLGPGLFEISGIAVEVDEAGTARRPGSPNLAGSTLTMPKLKAILSDQLGLSPSQIETVIDINPRKALALESSS